MKYSLRQDLYKRIIDDYQDSKASKGGVENSFLYQYYDKKGASSKNAFRNRLANQYELFRAGEISADDYLAFIIACLEGSPKKNKEMLAKIKAQEYHDRLSELTIELIKQSVIGEVESFLYDIGVRKRGEMVKELKSRKTDNTLTMMDEFCSHNALIVSQQGIKRIVAISSSVKDAEKYDQLLQKLMRKSSESVFIPLQVDVMSGCGLFIIGKNYISEDNLKLTQDKLVNDFREATRKKVNAASEVKEYERQVRTYTCFFGIMTLQIPEIAEMAAGLYPDEDNLKYGVEIGGRWESFNHHYGISYVDAIQALVICSRSLLETDILEKNEEMNADIESLLNDLPHLRGYFDGDAVDDDGDIGSEEFVYHPDDGFETPGEKRRKLVKERKIS
jgi:hypothetical protein